MRKIFSFLTAMIMVFSFAACSFDGAASPSADDRSEASGYYPITVTDQAGRTVTIEKEPQRLISAYYITSSLMIALDLDERIVGIENEPEKRAIYGLSSPGLLDLPQIGTAKELDIEGCAALEPDLLILPMKLKNTVPALEELGMTVLLVDPEDQERLNEMILLTGKATNQTERAEQLTAFLSEQQNFLADALDGVDTPDVYLAGNSSMLKTAGDAMYQADMIRLAGGSNAAGEVEDTYWAEIDYEQLLAWDPEYIILASSAKYTVEDVLSDPNLAACTAVQKKNVFQIPCDAESWDSPVPGSVLGAVWLAGVLHPDKVPADQCAEIMDAYYETFYGFTYTQN